MEPSRNHSVCLPKRSQLLAEGAGGAAFKGEKRLLGEGETWAPSTQKEAVVPARASGASKARRCVRLGWIDSMLRFHFQFSACYFGGSS